MRLLIVGANGGTGREMVRQALDRGHEVTALARDPSGLGTRVSAVAGDVLDAGVATRAVEGQEAVLFAAGRPAMKAGRVRSRGTANVVRAMERAGVRRLVVVSTIGVGGTRRMLPARYRYVLGPTLLRTTFAEHARQESAVRASALDWTIVRAGALHDDGDGEEPRHGTAAPDRPLRFTVTRADVAGFGLDLAQDGAYVREAPWLSA
jgi:nucleoside-diphosphate-sugar epimerase